MFCSKCGKEISDDSKFCSSCGSKINFTKSTENIEKDSIPPIKTESSTIIQDTKEEPQVIIKNPTDIEPPPSLHQKGGLGYGWLILILLYGKIVEQTVVNYKMVTITSILIQLYWFVLLFVIYFSYRKTLLKRKPLRSIKYSSFLSGVVSLFVVGCFLNISLDFYEGYQKKHEMNEFSKSFLEQTEKIKKQELEFSKMLMVNPKSTKDFENNVKTLDRYKIFIKEKRTFLNNLVNFFNDMKSKSKNKELLNVKIQTFGKLVDHMMTSQEVGTGMLKSYYITGNEKDLDEFNKIYLELQTLPTEVTKQINDIYKLL